MIAAVVTDGASPQTAKHCRAVLRAALNRAMKWGLVGRNAAALASVPRVPRKEVRAISLAEAKQLLAVLLGDRLEALCTVALAVGLRQSEALGLTWREVDFDTATLRIARVLQRYEREFHLDEPKTTASRRVVALPQPVVAALRKHRSLQAEERLRAGPAWPQGPWGELVFTTEAGTPFHGSHVTRRLQRLLKNAGLPHMRYHDLRHGAASLMAAQGVPPRVAMEILGHADIATTMNVYAHVAPEVQKEAAARIAEGLWG